MYASLFRCITILLFIFFFIVNCIFYLTGLRDIKTVSFHSTLAEIGMDSLMAVEVKQTLEREYELFLTAQDLRALTFAKLADYDAVRETEKQKEEEKPDQEDVSQQMNRLFFKYIGKQDGFMSPMIRLPSASYDEVQSLPIFCIPGIEGSAQIFENMAKSICCPVYGLQLSKEVPINSIQDMAKYFIGVKITFNISRRDLINAIFF